jgi:hypothetical protein
MSGGFFVFCYSAALTASASEMVGRPISLLRVRLSSNRAPLAA